MRNRSAPWWRFDWYPWPLNNIVFFITATLILILVVFVFLPTHGFCRVFKRRVPK